MNKPVLIAATLTEETASKILDILEVKFPGMKFSRILDGKSKTWKVHSLVSNKVTEIQIKRHCLKLMSNAKK